jgi:hypothetical protein
MGIIYSITKPKRKKSDSLVLAACWRVQLTAIELEETNTGKRLKWVFQTRDKQHTIVGYTKYSTWYRSKCAYWVRAVMNKNCLPKQVDLEQLIGNEVNCWFRIIPQKDGTERLVAYDLDNYKVGKP